MAEIAAIVAATSLVALVLYWLMLRISERVAYSKFETAPTHWLAGNVLDMEGPKLWGYLRKCLQINNKAYGNWMGSSFMVSLVHPETTKVELHNGTHKAWNYRLFDKWMGKHNMFSDGGEVWHAARLAYSPIFKTEMLKTYMTAYTTATTTLIDKWGKILKANEPKTFELHQDFPLLTLDLIFQAGFSFDSECQLKTHKLPECFANMIHLIWQRTVNPLLWPDFVYDRYSDGKKAQEYVDFVNEFCLQLVDDRVEKLNAGVNVGMTEDGRPADFLQHLLHANAGGRLSKEEIVAGVIGLIFAGFDTGCVALEWIFYAFGKFPEWQTKCRNEFLQVFGDSIPSHAQLEQLPIMTMFIKEVLRMWPPSPILGRSNPEELTVDGKKVPKNSWIEVGIWATHHNPELWPEPERFDPERFAPGKNIQPYSWIPFSAGRRSCLGHKFAMDELRTICGMLLREFEITPDPTFPEHPEMVAEVMLLTEPRLRVNISKLK